MTPAQINAINAAKKNGGRALTTAQVRAVGDEKAFAEATAKRDAWDNARAEHMAEMKAKVAANKYAHLTFEEIEDDPVLDDLLRFDPWMEEVLEYDDEDLPEIFVERLAELRAQTVEQNATELAELLSEFADDMGSGYFVVNNALIPYVLEEQRTGVKLPKVSDPVE